MQTKICTKCGIEKDITEFYSEKSGKFGVKALCKECKRKWSKEYNQKQEIKKHQKKYDQSDVRKKAHKEYTFSDAGKENKKKWYNEHRWCKTLESIKYRCNNINCEIYNRYGGRGIKCLITAEELKTLWHRDNAFKMKRPNIDRIDNDGNYEFSNCQYLENVDHTIKSHQERRIRNSSSPAPTFVGL